MTDLSREELKAHLSAVEAQVRAALRIVAAESKSVQQAHSALRADLSAALVRLQADINNGNSQTDAKIERLQSDVNNLSRQRKMTTAILGTLVLCFGLFMGLVIGGGYFLAQNAEQFQSFEIPGLTAIPDSAPAVESDEQTSATIIIGQ